MVLCDYVVTIESCNVEEHQNICAVVSENGLLYFGLPCALPTASSLSKCFPLYYMITHQFLTLGEYTILKY